MRSCIESGVVQEGAFEILTPFMIKFKSNILQISRRLEGEKGVNHAFRFISIVGEDLSLCHQSYEKLGTKLITLYLYVDLVVEKLEG